MIRGIIKKIVCLSAPDSVYYPCANHNVLLLFPLPPTPGGVQAFIILLLSFLLKNKNKEGPLSWPSQIDQCSWSL